MRKVSPIDVPSRYVENLVIVLAIGFVGLLAMQSRTYGGYTGTVPFIIAIPTLGLLTMVLLARNDILITDIKSIDVMDVVDAPDEEPMSDASSTADKAKKRMRFLMITFWILSLTLLVFVIGFVNSFLVFLVAFYRYQANLSWLRATILSVVIWATIYVTFVELLNVRFV